MKRKHAIILMGAFTAIVIVALKLTQNSSFSSSIEEEDRPDNHQSVTVYGTFQLTEYVDTGRSGLLVPDIYIEVDIIESKSGTIKVKAEDISSEDYIPLSWEVIIKNILGDDRSYVGLANLNDQFKADFMRRKVKVSGKIYEHCIDIYYLSPSDENPKSALTCWELAEPHHIRLSGYP